MKNQYPGTEEVEKQKQKSVEPELDFIGGKPNYDKFGWDAERVLVFLNID